MKFSRVRNLILRRSSSEKKTLYNDISKGLAEVLGPETNADNSTYESELRHEKSQRESSSTILDNIWQITFFIFFFASGFSIGLGLLLNAQFLLQAGSYILLPIWITLLILYLVPKYISRLWKHQK